MENALNVIKAILNALMTIIIIIGLVFIFLFFIGITPYVVESGSMEPNIRTGSLSFINTKVKYEDIKEDDVIAFKLPNGNLVTHRVVKITPEGFETKGDKNEKSDGMSTTKENYIGKNVFSISKVGYFVKMIQTKRGKIILGTVVVLLFVGGILIGEPDKKI